MYSVHGSRGQRRFNKLKIDSIMELDIVWGLILEYARYGCTHKISY